MSGSPVFVHLGGKALPDRFWEFIASFWDCEKPIPSDILQHLRVMVRDPHEMTDCIFLLGVMIGHFPIDKSAIATAKEKREAAEPLNTGIGVVVPIDYVWELLETDEAIETLQKEERRLSKETEIVLDTAEGTSKEQFEEVLKKVSKSLSFPKTERSD